VKGEFSARLFKHQIAEELGGTDISYTSNKKTKQLRFSFEERQAFRVL
jgi:hypothetical protein